MIGAIIGVVIIIVIIFILFYARRGELSGLTMLSHLKCPKCNSEFDYEYIPGASMTSLRLGGSRYLQCPVCHKWSVFNLRKTRVDPETHPKDHPKVGPS
jgi:uncharacterized C2H2 Zn-finger protein